MTNRKVKILYYMYLDCDDADPKKIDDLYKQNAKAVAIVTMLRVVRDRWIFLHKRIDQLERELRGIQKPSPVIEDGEVNDFGYRRIILN